MPYIYFKKVETKPKRKISHKTSRVLAGTFFFLGLFLIAQVIFPMLGSFVILFPEFSTEIVSPLASDYRPILPTPSIKPKEVQANYDAYRPSTWFVNSLANRGPDFKNSSTYTVSIPKLKIEKATVVIGGDDLKKSLIAWPTSAIPGSYGVTVIFGHSELPSLANPKNYSGIFTFIMDLKDKDEIFIDADNVRYRYLVFDKKVVEPSDLSVLEQRFDSPYLTLITCVPPGTLWKRGVVKARLVSL